MQAAVSLLSVLRAAAAVTAAVLVVALGACTGAPDPPDQQSPVPQPSTSAPAFAAVLERIRYGTLPAGLAQESLRQQAASMSAALAAKPQQWPRYWSDLQAVQGDPIDLVLRAIALGWKSKWT